MKLLTVLWLIAAVSVLAGPVAAHHGTGISYDLTAPLVTIKGTVTEFAWRNPHFGWYGLFGGITDAICAPINEVEDFNKRIRNPAGLGVQGGGPGR